MAHGGYAIPGRFHVSLVNNGLPVPSFLATLSRLLGVLYPTPERRETSCSTGGVPIRAHRVPTFHLACACLLPLETEWQDVFPQIRALIPESLIDTKNKV